MRVRWKSCCHLETSGSAVVGDKRNRRVAKGRFWEEINNKPERAKEGLHAIKAVSQAPLTENELWGRKRVGMLLWRGVREGTRREREGGFKERERWSEMLAARPSRPTEIDGRRSRIPKKPPARPRETWAANGLRHQHGQNVGLSRTETRKTVHACTVPWLEK